MNLLTVVRSEFHNTNFIVQLLKSFFYPIMILFSTQPWNDFHIMLSAYVVIGILLIIYTIKKIKPIMLIAALFLLGLANLRFVPPNTLFYSAFHLLPWYVLFIVFLVLLVKEYIMKKQYLFFFVLLLPVTIFSVRPSSFFREHVSMHDEYLTNYGQLNAVANTIKALSSQNQTVFLDGADELIYWQADRLSSYKYTWYTSVMPKIPKYAEARIEMLNNNPPDFYYRFCSSIEIPDKSLSDNTKLLYQQLLENGKPSCLYIKKTVIPTITSSQWEQTKKYLYTLPKN